mmetsp:Transcript_491/g.879  ORF Transcript_491/g.879 Transcript_491/m.879 type:complete len:175 (+) Transcript_491:74-598(+)
MKALLSFLLALAMSSAIMASSPLSPSYRLERLVVRSASYIYEDDKDHAYMATATVLDTRSDECAPSAVEVEFGLHIANRFRVTLCLTKQTPPYDHDDNTRYEVQVMGPMTSTRMMPVDEQVQQLEQQWSRALPAVTRATIDHDGFWRLTDDADDMEIVFREASAGEQDVGQGEE